MVNYGRKKFYNTCTWPLLSIPLNFDQQKFVNPYSVDPGPVNPLENIRDRLLLRFEQKDSSQSGFRAEIFETGELETLEEARVAGLGVAVLGQGGQGLGPRL